MIDTYLEFRVVRVCMSWLIFLRHNGQPKDKHKRPRRLSVMDLDICNARVMQRALNGFTKG